MGLVRDGEHFERPAAHQTSQPFLRVASAWNGVGLQVVFHLQTMLDVAQEGIGNLHDDASAVAGVDLGA